MEIVKPTIHMCLCCKMCYNCPGYYDGCFEAVNYPDTAVSNFSFNEDADNALKQFVVIATIRDESGERRVMTRVMAMNPYQAKITTIGFHNLRHNDNCRKLVKDLDIQILDDDVMEFYDATWTCKE